MGYPQMTRRPGSASFLGFVSVIYSGLALLGLVVGVLFVSLFGAAGWLLGPGIGVVASGFGALMIGMMALFSILSLLLCRAGFLTLADDPRGISLLRLWAWLRIGLDVLTLLFSGGAAITSWWGLAYAIVVLYVTSWPEIQIWYGRAGHDHRMVKPAGFDDDGF
jgi:hypothetical protein